MRHPRVEIALLTADRRAGKPMAEVFPQFAPYALPTLTAIDAADWAALGLDLVFCALPHGTTQKVIKDLLTRAPATKVVDLSADFRLADPAAYARWYGHEHFAPELQREAVYGLTEIYRAQDQGGASCRQSRAATRPARSLRSFRCSRPRRSIRTRSSIDAKSGMTGAGRAAKEEMLFSEVSEGFHAYGVGHHRHMAELDQEFSLAAGREVIGELHAASGADEPRHPLDDLCAGSDKAAPEDLHALLAKAYANEPFVHVLPFGNMPQTRHVRGSNMTFIGVAADRIAGRAIIVLGARQPDQGRVRPGGAEHEPDARLSGDDGARAGRAVSVSSAANTSPLEGSIGFLRSFSSEWRTRALGRMLHRELRHKPWRGPMRYPLFIFFPLALAAARSLAFGIQTPGPSEERTTISAETEYRFLLIAIFCLTGLLLTLGAMVFFPDLGAVIAEYNQI